MKFKRLAMTIIAANFAFTQLASAQMMMGGGFGASGGVMMNPGIMGTGAIGGGMMTCPYPSGPASGASNETDDLKELAKLATRDIREYEKEIRRLKRDQEKARKVIAGRFKSHWAEVIFRHMENGMNCETCSGNGGGPTAPGPWPGQQEPTPEHAPPPPPPPVYTEAPEPPPRVSAPPPAVPDDVVIQPKPSTPRGPVTAPPVRSAPAETAPSEAAPSAPPRRPVGSAPASPTDGVKASKPLTQAKPKTAERIAVAPMPSAPKGQSTLASTTPVTAAPVVTSPAARPSVVTPAKPADSGVTIRVAPTKGTTPQGMRRCWPNSLPAFCAGKPDKEECKYPICRKTSDGTEMPMDLPAEFSGGGRMPASVGELGGSRPSVTTGGVSAGASVDTGNNPWANEPTEFSTTVGGSYETGGPALCYERDTEPYARKTWRPPTGICRPDGYISASACRIKGYLNDGSREGEADCSAALEDFRAIQKEIDEAQARVREAKEDLRFYKDELRAIQRDKRLYGDDDDMEAGNGRRGGGGRSQGPSLISQLLPVAVGGIAGYLVGNGIEKGQRRSYEKAADSWNQLGYPVAPYQSNGYGLAAGLQTYGAIAGSMNGAFGCGGMVGGNGMGPFGNPYAMGSPLGGGMYNGMGPWGMAGPWGNNPMAMGGFAGGFAGGMAGGYPGMAGGGFPGMAGGGFPGMAGGGFPGMAGGFAGGYGMAGFPGQLAAMAGFAGMAGLSGSGGYPYPSALAGGGFPGMGGGGFAGGFAGGIAGGYPGMAGGGFPGMAGGGYPGMAGGGYPGMAGGGFAGGFGGGGGLGMEYQQQMMQLQMEFAQRQQASALARTQQQSGLMSQYYELMTKFNQLNSGGMSSGYSYPSFGTPSYGTGYQSQPYYPSTTVPTNTYPSTTSPTVIPSRGR